MTDQLPLFAAKPVAPPPADLPIVVGRIISAARSLSGQVRIVRCIWGVGMGPKRRWVLTSQWGCCALGALLVAEEAEYRPGDMSPSASVARLLSMDAYDVYRFTLGYDGDEGDERSHWFQYGRRVAAELGVA